jgi:radical SAM superfamily enzyme YgiQ (UPF0313 family)
MRIYLADLFHTYNAGHNPDTNPYTIPLGIGFLSSTVKRYCPKAEIRLFRDPDRFIEAVRRERPDIVGFSVCSWNTDLTVKTAALVKSICPEAAIVAGGPSVDDADEQILEFFRMMPVLDYLVPNEGESGFLALVRQLEIGRPAGEIIHGVAYLDAAGQLVRGRYERPVVPSAGPGMEQVSPKTVRPIDPGAIEIPSPYLDGTLDEFLDQGLVPIIQTMRGCPYQCHFCVSGATEWNKMRGYDVARVEAEIEYALIRSKTKDLILTDENWGILGDRDVDLARFIMNRHRTQGSPNRLYYYTAKIVTQASRDIVELVAPIAWIGEFSMSFQSLNPETRQAIKRTNISLDKLATHTQWARERDILTSSEMIYGFPFETPQTFFDGVETLVEQGISSVQIYPLQLFPGIDLANQSTREKYGLETGFRLSDCGYGIYDDGKLVAVETEEVVVGNRWSSLEDYLAVRRYAFFQMAIFSRGYFTELLTLCAEIHVSLQPIIRKLTLSDYSQYPALRDIMADHRRDAEAELKATKEEVYDEIVGQIRHGKSVGGVKLNLIYLARIMSSPQASAELFDLIRGFLQPMIEQHPQRDVILTYIDEVLPHRFVLLSPDVDAVVHFQSRFDYQAWSERRYDHLADLLLDQPHTFEATIHEQLRSNLADFDASDRAQLQGIFDKTRVRNVLRSVSAPVSYQGSSPRSSGYEASRPL